MGYMPEPVIDPIDEVSVDELEQIKTQFVDRLRVLAGEETADEAERVMEGAIRAGHAVGA